MHRKEKSPALLRRIGAYRLRVSIKSQYNNSGLLQVMTLQADPFRFSFISYSQQQLTVQDKGLGE